jgi:hypothetical protein
VLTNYTNAPGRFGIIGAGYDPRKFGHNPQITQITQIQDWTENSLRQSDVEFSDSDVLLLQLPVLNLRNLRNIWIVQASS